MHQLVTRICTTIIEDRFPLIFELEIENIPGCIADESLISQVWQNLLENAVKFTAKCKLRQIQIGSQKRDYDTVYFVRDSGVGFEMQYVDKIFGAFQRLHRENEFEGTGIGLAIVKKVIDRHDGKVWAESTVGKGSIIYFSIPDVIA
jgi:light-regulated signal transduction histidine kinase (bacteriophytochrome)